MTITEDPLNHQQLSLGIGNALMSSDHELRERAGEILQRTLFLLGDEDTLCEQESTQIKIQAMPNSEQICYPGLKHSLLIEERREEVTDGILNWL